MSPKFLPAPKSLGEHSRPAALLIEVSSRVRPQLSAELTRRGFAVVENDETGADTVELAIVEGDRGPGMLARVHEIRERLPATVVIAITGWWNDLEGILCHEADAVLHVPLSQRECERVLHGFDQHELVVPHPRLAN